MLIEIDEYTNVHLALFCNMVGDALQQIEAVLNQNSVLCIAYNISREETAALKVAVDTLT
jgi:hypothetical protein